MPMNYDDRAAFLATGNSRETSDTVMEAIAAFSADIATAEMIWEEGIEHWLDCDAKRFLDIATRDGAVDVADLCWGCSGGLEIVPTSLRAEFE